MRDEENEWMGELHLEIRLKFLGRVTEVAHYKIDGRQRPSIASFLRLIAHKLTVNLQVISSNQQASSAEEYPTIYRVLPAFEEFRDELVNFTTEDGYEALRPAIYSALKVIDKYHGKATRSSCQVVCLCKYIHTLR